MSISRYPDRMVVGRSPRSDEAKDIAGDAHLIAEAQLAPAPVLCLAVDEDFVGGQETLDVTAGVNDTGQLQQLPEADDVVSDR